MTLTINFDFRKLMLKHNFSLNYCYQCGTCSGACPIARITEGKYNPRKIMEAAILGFEDKLTEELEPNVWLCTFCQLCVEQCPQHVDLTEIFLQIKNIAVKNGKAPDAFHMQAETVYTYASAVPIGISLTKRREKLGLPKLKPLPVDEVQKLMKATNFDQLLEISKKKRSGE